MDYMNILNTAALGIGYVVLFLVALVFLLYAFIFLRGVARVYSFWSLTMEACENNPDVVRSEYRERSFWKVQLFFSLLRYRYFQLTFLGDGDTISNDLLFFSVNKRYAKG